MDEALDRVERIFAEHSLPGAPDIEETRVRARRRALAMLGAHGEEDRERDGRVALLLYSADLLAALAIELAAHREEAAELIERVAEASGLSREALAREVLRTPSLLGFPPAMAIEVQLGLLMAFAPLDEISLWMADEAGAIHAVNRIGDGQASTRAQELARRLLGGRARAVKRGALLGLAVGRWDQHVAALIARPIDQPRERCLPALEEATPALGAILERDRLISRNLNAERTFAETHERRLARLGFDIHDGPLQDLALLGDDLRRLRSLCSGACPIEESERTGGRLDDIEAQLAALDSNLRRISASLQSPFTVRQSVPDTLADMAGAFAARSGVEPAIEVEGDLAGLTDSQQMALLSIAREALSNVREHSQASEVTVSLAGRPLSIELHITDNGIGFDVEKTLVRAARDGRMGLVGLYERARLLGGASHIDSGPGRPTTISVTLPRWRPVEPKPE